MAGIPHFNKVTHEYVATPHAQGPDIPGGVRAALPNEVPPGWCSMCDSTIGWLQDWYLNQGAQCVESVAHVGISLAATVDPAEKGDYAKAGENRYQATKAIARIALAAIGAGVVGRWLPTVGPFFHGMRDQSQRMESIRRMFLGKVPTTVSVRVETR